MSLICQGADAGRLTQFSRTPLGPQVTSRGQDFPNILRELPMKLSEKALNDLPSLLQELCRVSQRTPNQLIKGPRILNGFPGNSQRDSRVYPRDSPEVFRGIPGKGPGNSRRFIDNTPGKSGLLSEKASEDWTSLPQRVCRNSQRNLNQLAKRRRGFPKVVA